MRLDDKNKNLYSTVYSGLLINWLERFCILLCFSSVCSSFIFCISDNPDSCCKLQISAALKDSYWTSVRNYMWASIWYLVWYTDNVVSYKHVKNVSCKKLTPKSIVLTTQTIPRIRIPCLQTNIFKNSWLHVFWWLWSWYRKSYTKKNHQPQD